MHPSDVAFILLVLVPIGLALWLLVSEVFWP